MRSKVWLIGYAFLLAAIVVGTAFLHGQIASRGRAQEAAVDQASQPAVLGHPHSREPAATEPGGMRARTRRGQDLKQELARKKARASVDAPHK